MRKLALCLALLLATSCGLRAKQGIGLGLVASAFAVDVEMEGRTQSMQVARLGLSTLLILGAIGMCEWDAQRDTTGEHVALVVRTKLAPEPDDYVQEICSQDVMICMGPYPVHHIDAVRRLRGGRWYLWTTIVSTVPTGARVFRVVIPGPAETRVLKGAR